MNTTSSFPKRNSFYSWIIRKPVHFLKKILTQHRSLRLASCVSILFEKVFGRTIRLGGMGCSNSSIIGGTPISYFDSQGRLITFVPNVKRSRKEELIFVNKEESSRPFEAGEECYLINSKWLAKWLKYCSSNSYRKARKYPGPISNYLLVDEDHRCLKSNLKLKEDFRPVKEKVWVFLYIHYGGGPVLYFNGKSVYFIIVACLL